MIRGQTTHLTLGASLVAAAAVFTACGTGTTDRTVRRINGPNGPLTFVSSFVNPDQVEKIIGTNELTPVLKDGANIPAKYGPLIDAFGKISMGCTATHIGNSLVLTAGHCFEAPEKRINNKPCAGVTVDWGYRKDKAAYLKSKCLMVLAAELNDNRDYAIFRVDQAPTAKVEIDLSAKAKTGSTLTIFGHPQLRPLEWSQTCTLEDASRGGWGTDEFSHQCDTEPGNSGSTIIDDNSLKVVGIHDGGRIPWNYGTFLVNTPLAEFVGGSTPTNPAPTPAPAPTARPTPPSDTIVKLPNRVFGPFSNNSKMVLSSFGVELGSSVSFDIVVDVEEGYDFVTIKAGDNLRFEISGAQKRHFDRLMLPVEISFRSDEAGPSKRVSVLNVQARKSSLPNP